MVTIRIAGIVRDSIVDGEGIRDVIFLQGCHRACKGCHNPTTWDMNGGEEVSVGELVKQFSHTSNAITISGGEPLLQLHSLVELLWMLRRNGHDDIWLYTGFTFEEAPSLFKALSSCVNVVVDGAYEEDKRDTNLLFRGSSNQRLIDLKKSVSQNKVVEYIPY